MRKWIILCLPAMMMALVACNNNSYSKNLSAEKKLIENYMSRNGYRILDELPEVGQWGEKDYYRVPSTSTDYCFFHLVNMGDTAKKTVTAGELVVLRYRQYTLTEPADTANYWTTLDSAYPTEFNYYTDNTGASCAGWQLAIGLMKYPEAECKIIVPSKLGFSRDQNSVIPYGYDMKMKIKR